MPKPNLTIPIALLFPILGIAGTIVRSEVTTGNNKERIDKVEKKQDEAMKAYAEQKAIDASQDTKLEVIHELLKKIDNKIGE